MPFSTYTLLFQNSISYQMYNVLTENWQQLRIRFEIIAEVFPKFGVFYGYQVLLPVKNNIFSYTNPLTVFAKKP